MHPKFGRSKSTDREGALPEKLGPAGSAFRRYSKSSKVTRFNRVKIQEEHPQRGHYIHGVGKICDLRLYRKPYETGQWLLWNTNSRSQVADRSVSVPVTGREAPVSRQISVLIPLS